MYLTRFKNECSSHSHTRELLWGLNSSVLLIDLGRIKIDSKLVDAEKGRDYTRCLSSADLYDAYNFELKDFKVHAFEKLKDYKRYRDSRSTKMVEDVTFKINLLNNIEPNHLTMPQYELNLSLENIQIMFSDYLM